MIDKLCVCGHAMEDRGAQTLEMNGSSLGSNLWTDHVEVDVYICPWCGRMAFFEPEDVRETPLFGMPAKEIRWRSCVRSFTIANPDMLRDVARERIEELESTSATRRSRSRKEEERRAKRKKFFSGILGKDDGDDKPTKNRPPEF